MKKMFLFCLCAAMMLCACSTSVVQDPTVPQQTQGDLVTRQVSADATKIQLSDNGITVDGSAVSADATDAVYAAKDIVFYLEGQDFTYGEGTKDDEHSQEEADRHTVVHITKPGEYILSGKLSAGQIAVDLGKDAKSDPNAVVTLVLNNVDITCTVAPAVIFYNVYECGSADEATATSEVDTASAGANVIIADNSNNNIHGSYVARIYKSVELNEDKTEVIDSKKLHKYDGAFYSKMTMNIYGEKGNSGVLNIYAENEGLDSELHLTIFSGNLNIDSGNDGINTNEDNVSVARIMGGVHYITVNGSTGEGDGIDSNGWLIIDGGMLFVSACGFSGDSGIDADKGVFINGGFVAASGNMLDALQGTQTYVVLAFSQRQKGGNDYDLKNETFGRFLTCSPANDFQYLIISSPHLTPDNYTLWREATQLQGSKSMGQMNSPGAPGPGGPDGMPPAGMERPEGTPPAGMERPEGTPPAGMGDPNIQPGGSGNPNGTPPAPPEGGMPGGQPGGFPGGFPGGNQGQPQEFSPIFEITEGANFFQVVTA